MVFLNVQELKEVSPSLAGSFRLEKSTAVLLIVSGLVLVFLGYTGTFTLIGCGPGPSCIRIVIWNFLAIVLGLIAMVVGALSLIRTNSNVHE